MPCRDGDGAVRVAFVDVDDQDMAGVGFDVVEVGDLRRAGVPHPSAAADLGARMLVTQRHVMQCTACQRVVERGEPDQRGFVAIGVEHVDATVGEEDASRGPRFEADEDLGDQVGGGRLGTPWRGDDLEPRSHLVHAGAVEHHDVVRALGGEQRAGVHRRRVQRVVIARQQVHRNVDGTHGFQGLADDLRGELIVFEHVTGDHDELGAHLDRQRAESGHRVAAGGRIPRLGVAGKEVPGHAQLPVGGVQESHPDPF